jgi:NADH:ubiquinone oxidoreductase subunit D
LLRRAMCSRRVPRDDEAREVCARRGESHASAGTDRNPCPWRWKRRHVSGLAHGASRTAVVERRWIGGSCPNTNCLPSKNEIWSAKVADLVHHAASLTIGRGSPRRAARAHAERARGSVMTSSLLSGLQEGVERYRL